METSTSTRKTQPLHPAAKPHDRDAEESNYWQNSLRAYWFQGKVTAIAAAAGIVGLFFLYLTLKATNDTVNATRSQAGSALSQAQTAQDALEFSQRAWVSVEIDSAGPIPPVPRTPKESMQIPLKFSLTGEGLGVAENVTFNQETLPIADIETPETILKEQHTFCDDLRGGYTPYNPEATTLFPKQTKTRYLYPVISWKDIVDAEKQLHRLNKTVQRNLIHPILIGCVNYTYGIAQGRYHQTGFIYYIEPYDPQSPNTPFWIDVRYGATQWTLREFEAGEAFYVD
jgi:hypothetical protein